MYTKLEANRNTRILNIEGVINFRDLGGYQSDDGRQVKWGKVYRSAQLDRMSSEGVRALSELGIKAVVDLRFSEESAKYPTMQEAVPLAEMLSWHDEFQDDGDLRASTMQMSWKDSLDSLDPQQVREAMRINYPQKLYSHRAIYRKMLLCLAHDKTPLVFHCAAGKDRTGVAAALILSLLGVSDQQIVEDYLLTQNEVANLLDSWLAAGATDSDDYEDFQQRMMRLPREVIQPVFEADQAYIETLLEYVNKTYSSFAAYALEVLDFTEQDQALLKERLLVAAV
ncbi:MAG: protein-tyrosine phosphatase [Cryomorphaceae bacterium]|jgi:protein-tyrosine phosphatase